MGYLGVNIHQNIVILPGTGLNDEGTFVIKLSSKVDDGAMFAAFDEGADTQADTNDMKIWSIKVTDWENKMKTPAAISQDLINLKLNLIDILSTQMPMDKAKAALNAGVMFAGLGITVATQATLPQRLVDQNFVDAVYKNLANGFVQAMTPYFGANPFRLKLRRQSKKKHFPMIPPRSKFNETWIESMLIPEEASKISWSEYEIKSGLNHGVPQETDQAKTEDKKKVDDMFASPEAGAASPNANPMAAPTQPGAEAAIPAAPVPPADAAPFTQQDMQVPPAQPAAPTQPAQPTQPAAAPVNPFNG